MFISCPRMLSIKKKKKDFETFHLFPFFNTLSLLFHGFQFKSTLALKAQYLKTENDSDIQMPHLSKELICQCKNVNKTRFKGLT